MKEEKQADSQKILVGIGVAAVVIVIGLMAYGLRATDPAASGPIAYKKFDYGAHMQDQMRDFKRQRSPTIVSMQSQSRNPNTP